MRRFLFLVGFLLIGSFSTFSQTEVGKAQAFFIYNFSRLIKWPANYSQGEFIVGIFGNTTTYNDLQTLTKDKMVGSRKFVVKKFSSLDDISDCHILLIASDRKSNINKVVSKLRDKHTLIISETKGLNDLGSAIDFLVVDNKLRFTMNIQNAEKYDLIVSRSLLDMALIN